MVDFSRLMDKKGTQKKTDPIEIFNRLDKKAGKEYLRPPQEYVLKEWYNKFRSQKDVIVKLHTGQGKTLIGLLMLQSSINENLGPALYLCPDNYLVDQTIDQAKSFGINVTSSQSDTNTLPHEFLNSNAILVTTCHKMFNGKSVFGVMGSNTEIIEIGSVVMDDAHKCIDIIKEQFSINISRDNNASLWDELWSLFNNSLFRQKPGTAKDIEERVDECIMAVPYWSWYDKLDTVIDVLHDHKNNSELKFTWDLIKDKLEDCMCIFSGKRLHITPRFLPIEKIPSFNNAKRRIFLSATLTEDAFLLRDLGIDKQAISRPLIHRDTKYSGERMIIIPMLIDTSLTEGEIINWLSDLVNKHGEFGVVSIIPSRKYQKFWSNDSSIIADKTNIKQELKELGTKIENKNAKKIVVLVNKYDGVDLPDDMCRILILHSLPQYTSLFDEYVKNVRQNSVWVRRLLAQRIEQGMGRGIRGKNDWCIVIVIGNKITDFLSTKSKRKFLSIEAQKQIEISEELAQAIKNEGRESLESIEELVEQCIKRDEGWKEYYCNKMNEIDNRMNNELTYLRIAELEREAELLYQKRRKLEDVEKKLQQIIDEIENDSDKGWYLQLIAMYYYSTDKIKSNDKQLKAHEYNKECFRPEEGTKYNKIIPESNRVELILEFIRRFENTNALIIELNNKLEDLQFGHDARSDLFEEAIDMLGKALGFKTQRPEKETGEGPDNLWCVDRRRYWIIECKNRVKQERQTISKNEISQLNNSIGWFTTNYGDNLIGVPILIHPASKLGEGAYIDKKCYVMTPELLEKLKKNVLNFYKNISNIPQENIDKKIIEMLDSHSLRDLKYYEEIKL